MTKYIIKNAGFYVAGFSNRGQGCVLITSDIMAAKQFDSTQQATKWATKYADAGYGLSSTFTIIEMPEVL